MPVSPDTGNYRIGKGSVYFQKSGDTTLRHLGNCTSFTYTPNIDKLDHFSSMTGTKTKDLSVVIQVGASIKVTMEEITGPNLAMFALGDQTTDTDGNVVIQGLSQTTFQGLISIVGDNDVGQQVDFEANVSFIPTGDFEFINDGSFSTIELTADVLVDGSGNYGTWTIRDV